MSYIFSVLSFFIAVLGAWLIASYGWRLGLIDRPNDRSSHNRNVPKGGGIGILVVFFLAGLLLDLSWTFWMPASCLSLVSFLGDRLDLSSKLRLCIQFIAAGIVLYNIDKSFWISIGHDNLFFDGFHIIIYSAILIFTVGTTNFYNFMDGIDGIAGITGVVSFAFLAYVSSIKGNDSLTVLSMSISFACLGFLVMNIPKAKVFMGDVGSILLGFIFSILVVLLSDSVAEFICFSGFLLPFYSDEIVTMLERMKDRDPLTKAHRRHLYQMLANEGGIRHWKISLGYGLFQLTICLFLLLIHPLGIGPILLLIIAFFGIFTIVSVRVKQKLV